MNKLTFKAKIINRKIRKKYYSKLRDKWMSCDYTDKSIRIPSRIANQLKNKTVLVTLK